MRNSIAQRNNNTSTYYSERLARYGPTVEALGWGSTESQRLRFDVLCEIAPLEARSILDFGCGFGDLYQYLIDRYITTRYIGCDSNPEMLAEARRRHPDVRFTDTPESADYIMASGTFNLDYGWRETVRRLWDLAQRGMAINFTSCLTDKPQNPAIIYENPFAAGLFCATLTKKFVILHNYLPNDFTIYCYK